MLYTSGNINQRYSLHGVVQYMKLLLLSESIQTKDIMKAANAVRGSLGLNPLKWNNRLGEAAQYQAEVMARLDRLDHDIEQSEYPTLKDRVGAAGYRYVDTAENIASKFKNADGVIDGWMNSPPHKKALTYPEFVHAGVGIATSKSGVIYVCQVYGAPSDNSGKQQRQQRNTGHKSFVDDLLSLLS